MTEEYFFDYGDGSYDDCTDDTSQVCSVAVEHCPQKREKDKYKFYTYDALYDYSIELGNIVKLETGLPLDSAFRLVAEYSLDTQKAICEWNKNMEGIAKRIRITDFSPFPNEPPEREMVKVSGGQRSSVLLKYTSKCDGCYSTDSEPGSMFSSCDGRHVFCSECWVSLLNATLEKEYIYSEGDLVLCCPFVDVPCVYPKTLTIFDSSVPAPSGKALASEKVEALARRGAPFSFDLTSYVVKARRNFSRALCRLEDNRLAEKHKLEQERLADEHGEESQKDPIKRFVECHAQCGMFIVDYSTIEMDSVDNASEIASYKKNQNMFAKCEVCESCTCLRCDNNEHGPATCSNMRKWEEQNKSDERTREWMIKNAKHCPGCRKNSIEKNGGCNHMTCTQCRHEFCWVCLLDWSRHGSNYYNCNVMPVKKDNYTKSVSGSDKDSLDRYLHFFERYNNHRISKKLDDKTMKRVIEYVESTTGTNQFEADKSYLKQIAKELSACRHTLMHSYVYAYYADEKKVNMGLFEHTQGELEHATEMLSAAVETNDFKLERQEVMNRASRATSILDILRGADYSLNSSNGS